jgi:hypothetical protein
MIYDKNLETAAPITSNMGIKIIKKRMDEKAETRFITKTCLVLAIAVRVVVKRFKKAKMIIEMANILRTKAPATYSEP